MVPPQRVSSPVHASERAANGVDAVGVRGHSRTALDVEQDVVDGVTDLAGEQAERVDVRAVAEADRQGEQQAYVAALEVSPVALSFETEHERCQPASGSRPDHQPCRQSASCEPSGPTRNGATESQRVAARTVAAVDTGVETAPVIGRSDHRGRLGVRTRRQIRSNSRRSRAERDQTGRYKQKLLHYFIPVFLLDSPQGRDTLIASSVRITVTSLPQPARNEPQCERKLYGVTPMFPGTWHGTCRKKITFGVCGTV